MTEHTYVLGVDIGGTNIRLGLVDEEGNLSGYQKISQQSILYGDDTIQSLAEYFKGYLQEFAKDKQVIALAAGIPAAMSRDRSTVWNAPNIKGFSGRNVKEVLQPHFSFPVLLEKDVTMLFYYDLMQHKIPHKDVLIACYIGTGIGNVISVDGKVLIGNDGAAGELGHIPVWDKTDICNCGNEGCMESHVGGKYLVELREKRFPDVEINQLFTVYGDTPEMERYLEHLSLPITTEINILNPAVIILGGGVLSMPDFPREKLEHYIYKHSRKPLPADNLKLVYSDNQGENGIYGAAIYAREILEQRKGE